MHPTHPKITDNYDDGGRQLRREIHGFVAPHRDEQQPGRDKKQCKPGVEDEMLIAVEETKVRQPDQTGKEQRVTIVFS